MPQSYLDNVLKWILEMDLGHLDLATSGPGGGILGEPLAIQKVLESFRLLGISGPG